MPPKRSVIRRLGIGREKQSAKRIEHAREFELSADELSSPSTPNSIFSLASAASSVTSFSSFGSIRRLGSRTDPQSPSDRSSVMFDADEHLNAAEIHQPVQSPTPEKTVAPNRGAGSSIGKPIAAAPIEPSGSALGFLQKVSELGIHAAIAREVQARQAIRVREFSAVWNARGMEAAVQHAVGEITDRGRSGRPENANVTKSLARLNVLGAGDGQAKRAGFNIEQLQNYYHRDHKGAHMSSADIAENFQRNGANLAAAELTLAFVESSHDSIQANEINSPDAAMKRETKRQAPAEPQKSRASYDDRSRGPALTR